MATYKLLAAGRDSSGYYYTRWDRATPITVKAETEAEALEKAKKALGTPPGVSDSWAFRLIEIVVD